MKIHADTSLMKLTLNQSAYWMVHTEMTFGMYSEYWKRPSYIISYRDYSTHKYQCLYMYDIKGNLCVSYLNFKNTPQKLFSEYLPFLYNVVRLHFSHAMLYTYRDSKETHKFWRRRRFTSWRRSIYRIARAHITTLAFLTGIHDTLPPRSRRYRCQLQSESRPVLPCYPSSSHTWSLGASFLPLMFQNTSAAVIQMKSFLHVITNSIMEQSPYWIANSR
jgi:hypothetical protein